MRKNKLKVQRLKVNTGFPFPPDSSHKFLKVVFAKFSSKILIKDMKEFFLKTYLRKTALYPKSNMYRSKGCLLNPIPIPLYSMQLFCALYFSQLHCYLTFSSLTNNLHMPYLSILIILVIIIASKAALQINPLNRVFQSILPLLQETKHYRT